MRVCLILLCVSLFEASLAPPVQGELKPLQRETVARVDSLWLAGAREEAHALVAERIPAARAATDSLFLLNLLARQGQMWAVYNQTREAIPILEESLALADALDDSTMRCASRRWMGVALYGQGSLAEGVVQFRDLLTLSQEHKDKKHEGYAWMGLAYYDWQCDAPQQARVKYTRSASILQELGDLRGELWARIGLGNALSRLGEYEEALAGNHRILEIGRQGSLPGIEALGHNNLGVLLYSLGDPSQALVHFRRAYTLQTREGDLRESVIAGGNVCLCEIILGRIQPAMRRLHELLRISREQGYMDQQAGLLGRLATASRQQGHYKLAARLYRESLNTNADLTKKHECDALVGLSATLAAMDSSEAGLLLLRRNASRMLSLDDPLLQSQYRAELGRRLLETNLAAEALEILMATGVRDEELGLTGNRMEALQTAGRAARALDLPDSAKVLLRKAAELWEGDRDLPLDPEWREQRGASGHELFAQLIGLMLEHPPDQPVSERTRQAFDILQAYKARTLLERMLGPAGKEAPPHDSPPITLAELQTDVLAPGELLLDFLLGEEQSVLFACTREECRALVLPSQKVLGAKLQLFHEFLANPPACDSFPEHNKQVISVASREIYDLLCSPLADLISQSRHLVLAPDGIINILPISSFFFDTTQEDLRTEPVYAPQAFSRVPSATVFARLRREDEDITATSGRILALEGPSTPAGQSLPGTKAEVRWLTHHLANTTVGFPSGGLTQSAAGSMEHLLADFDVLHFAAHSDANNQYPWRSSIHLSGDRWTGQLPENDESHTITLYASDIARWKLSSHLVVLSSCQSAGGRILSGEGVQGLTSAFLSAGAQSVLATLWPVDDLVTTDLIRCFYCCLRDGYSASAALREAQLSLAQNPETADPFYWAGFVLVGDGDLRVELMPRRSLAWLWMLALGLLLAGLTLCILHRRKQRLLS